MRDDYRSWLEQQKYVSATVNAQIYRVGRVEEYYGDLGEHFSRDRMSSVLATLRYTSSDARRNQPNPSKIPVEGDIANNLASYRNALERYRSFLENGDVGSGGETSVRGESSPSSAEEAEPAGRRFGLERDMQAALRANIAQLEESLTIVDDGAERSVDSGFIDITAKDRDARTVVIELKAGAAGQRAVAQILSYMGDVAAEEENRPVRGILVASDFDAKAKSAARVVPQLQLRRYSVRFTFSDGNS